MATPKTEKGAALRIARTFQAPREKVFQAWTDPRALEKWFGPDENYATTVHELDLRVGGRYALEMRHSGGNVYRLTGTYREIRAPERLVYTWRWLRGVDPEFPETLVTVEFREVGNATEVVVTHELLPEAEREPHQKGWTGCLDRLPKAL